MLRFEDGEKDRLRETGRWRESNGDSEENRLRDGRMDRERQRVSWSGMVETGK